MAVQTATTRTALDTHEPAAAPKGSAQIRVLPVKGAKLIAAMMPI